MKLIHQQIYQPRQETIKSFQIRFSKDIKFTPGCAYIIKIYKIEFEEDAVEL